VFINPHATAGQRYKPLRIPSPSARFVNKLERGLGVTTNGHRVRAKANERHVESHALGKDRTLTSMPRPVRSTSKTPEPSLPRQTAGVTPFSGRHGLSKRELSDGAHRKGQERRLLVYDLVLHLTS
jgi:hypothetical protein